MPIRQRQIYWLQDCEPLDGVDEKDRPVIVLTNPAAMPRGDFPLIVACTTSPREKDVPRFEIPSRKVNADTGLPQTCWALPRWYLPINPFRLTVLKGNCPLEIFEPPLAATLAQI